jgi:sugar/nucleoside kinase (ribokinase family)
MNYLIIGHSVVDKIIENEKTIIKPGGIFYSIISLLNLIEPQDKIYLCTNLDIDNAGLFEFIYNKIEKDFISTVKEIPEVELKVSGNGERQETYSAIAGNLEIPFDQLNLFEGILINMITGYDISLYQLKELRKNYNGSIYFDVHTLSRGVDENLNRNFRPIKNFDEWAVNIDILQANKSELMMLSKMNDEISIIKNLLECGIQQVIVTRSINGATVYFKDSEAFSSISRDAIRVNAINKVGCGDVFGAVYFYNYIKNKNIHAALEFANICAGISTTYSELKDFTHLKNDANERLG